MDTNAIEKYVLNQIEMSPKLSNLSLQDRLCFGVTGLNEEAGEVAGLLCREVYKKVQMPADKWVEELGDVLWYLVCATSSKGMTLEDLWAHNVVKLSKRYGADRERS